MSKVEDHSELPDFLSPKTLATICVDLSHRYVQAISEGKTEQTIRLGRLLTYYWESLRAEVDLSQATNLINEVELN